MSDSVRPQRQQPTKLPGPWDSPGRNTGVDCHFLLPCMKMKSESEVAQSFLSDPMDCSPPGSSGPWIFQARVLEWDAIAFSNQVLYRLANNIGEREGREGKGKRRNLKKNNTIVEHQQHARHLARSSLHII